jgi:tRNA pseudouridine38-40 synthase
MPRFALKIDYDGGPFAGWQRQAGGLPSVQSAIETALARLEPGIHNIAAAGRTDAGVHATAQIAHCELARDWDPFRLAEAINWHLKPLPIAVIKAAPVADDFHARFSALERHYVFRLVARRPPVTHDRGLVWQVLKPLDLQAMRAGAALLVGHHDFTTFRSTFCQAKSPEKTLDEITVTEHPYAGGAEYRFFLRARSFLHNQVRSIVGTLERVGFGGWQPKDVKTALDARNRAACGPVCPPHGLYLSAVKYATDPFAD